MKALPWFFIILVVLGLVASFCFMTSNVSAASYSRDISDTVAISETVQVHKYPTLLETLTLAEFFFTWKFTPNYESIPVGEVFIARKYTPSSEYVSISEAVFVTVYEVSEEAILIPHTTPKMVNVEIGENLALSDQGGGYETYEGGERETHGGGEGAIYEVQISEKLSVRDEGTPSKPSPTPSAPPLLQIIGGTLTTVIVGVGISTFLRKWRKGKKTDKTFGYE